jgi:hypothetical protein
MSWNSRSKLNFAQCCKQNDTCKKCEWTFRKPCLKSCLVEWWMIHLFSCKSPSLKLNFCYPHLNLSYGLPWEKSNSPLPIWEISLILHKASIYLQSPLAFVPETIPSHTHTTFRMFLPPRKYPSLGICAQSCSGCYDACYKGPFPTLLGDSQPLVHCSHSKFATTRQWDMSPLEWGPHDPCGNKVCPHMGHQIVLTALSK